MLLSSMKEKLLLLGIVLAVRMALGAEGVDQFAKKSLGLDLTAIPFGKPAATNGGYAVTAPPLSMTFGTNEEPFTWRTSAVSKQYHDRFPNRELVFGFSGDRLAAVRVTIDAINHNSHENRAELLQFYNELFSDDLSSRSVSRRFPFDDRGFHLKVSASCGLNRESLYIMEFHITPADVKKTE
jgi:hypothetical protein